MIYRNIVKLLKGGAAIKTETKRKAVRGRRINLLEYVLNLGNLLCIFCVRILTRVGH